MWNILGSRGKLCDSLSRRELLTVGGIPLIGLSLPQLFRSQALAAETDKRLPGFGQAKSVIFVYLQGAPSHIDLWDPKPGAPIDIRGEFQPISTSAGGVFIGEVLPKLAQEADKFTIIRTVGCKPKGLPNHGSAIYMLMTGHDSSNFSPTGLSVPPSRDDLPSVGSVVALHAPPQGDRFGYVALCGPVKENVIVGVGQGAGLLGAGYDPFAMYDDPTKPLKLETFSLPGDVSLNRLKERTDLRKSIDKQLREQVFASSLARSKLTELMSFDSHYSKALTLIQSNAAIQAFHLDDEPASVRERYGWTRFGQSCLLARRLVEAGTRFIQVTWPARSDDEPVPGPDGSWDTHRNNFTTLRNDRCPVFDHTLSGLIADLQDRGLIESTLVVAIGEFGRSPKIGSPTTNNVGPGGRDHWPECYSALVAGAGIRPGRTYGESDRFGAYPKSNPVHPYDLLSTVFHAVGINPDIEYRDNLNRPRRLVDHGSPVLGLYCDGC